MIHHGNSVQKEFRLPPISHAELEICMRTYGKYEHTFRKTKKIKELQCKGERIGVGENCCLSKCVSLNAVYYFNI